jgi:ribosomal protein L11 methyltransferase
MKQWITLRLRLPRESEEAVSNFLIERGAGGIEEVEEDLQSKTVRAYLLRNGNEKRVLEDLKRYLKSLEKFYAGISRSQVEVTSIEEKDWSGSWRKFFKPLRVASKFVVAPPWSSGLRMEKRIVIRINPGMAFGTGTHATTQLCLQALERRVTRKKTSVLDVGTGSGILAIAAWKLGASEVAAIDVDGAALENARENLVLNDVQDYVRTRKGRIGTVRGSFDVVVANIDTRNLKKMVGPLTNHLNGGGFLILSGILGEELRRIRELYWKTGRFRWVKAFRQDEWGSLTLKKK